jgi:hypothetical protein
MPETLVKQAGGGSIADAIMNNDNSESMNFDKGGYAFHKPKSSDSYRRNFPMKYNMDYVPRAVDGSTDASLTVSNYHSEFNAPDGWVVYGVWTPPGPTGTPTPYPGGLCHVTFAWSIEYWHYDVWVGKQLPPLGAEEYLDIMQLIGRAPQFHCNSLHISDIRRWYNKAMPFAHKIAPTVFKLLRSLGPQASTAAGVLEAVGNILPNEW